MLPKTVRSRARRAKVRARPAATAVIRNLPSRRLTWGSLRRTAPLSRRYGWERGTPVDRFYVERFLAARARDIRGEVMEVRDAAYATRFGGTRVRGVHIVDNDASNPDATLVADLCVPGSLPERAYDSIVLTQTLHILADQRAALQNLWRSLRPGGVLLITGPFCGRIDHQVAELDMWRYTPRGLARLLDEVLDGAVVSTEGHGNVLACAAFLYGVAQEELRAEELEQEDPAYPLVVCARVERPAA